MGDNENKEIRRNKTSSAVIFATSMFYAIIRYNFFGDVALTQIPAYIVNKALAVSAIIYFLMVARYHLSYQKTSEKYFLKCGTYMLTLHILISLPLFSKIYYPEFYQNDMLRFSGEMLLLSGAVAVILFWNQNKALFLRFLMLIFVAFHLFFMGYRDWVTIDKWNGKLPPISLIGFLVAIGGMIIWGVILAKPKFYIKKE